MLLGELSIGVGDINSKLSGIDSKMAATMGGFARLGTAVAAAGAAIAAAAGLISGFGGAINFGGQLNDLSLQTGETAGDLVILRQAFENSGLGADAAGGFILKLQDTIAGVNSESKNATAALARMGITAGELRTQTALQQIETLQAGFAKLDQTARVATARDLFGKSGGQALALLNDPGALNQARDQASPLAATMQANMAAFDALGDALNGVALSGKEFFAGFLQPLAPFFTQIATALSSVDFTAIGRAFGNIAAGIFNVFEIIYKGVAKVAEIADTLTGGLISSGAKAVGNFLAGPAPTALGGTSTAGIFSGGTALPQQSVVSALQRIGGGGGFGGGSDPLLSEAQRQTGLLQRIADKIGGSSAVAVPV